MDVSNPVASVPGRSRRPNICGTRIYHATWLMNRQRVSRRRFCVLEMARAQDGGFGSFRRRSNFKLQRLERTSGSLGRTRHDALAIRSPTPTHYELATQTNAPSPSSTFIFQIILVYPGNFDQSPALRVHCCIQNGWETLQTPLRRRDE